MKLIALALMLLTPSVWAGQLSSQTKGLYALFHFNEGTGTITKSAAGTWMGTGASTGTFVGTMAWGTGLWGKGLAAAGTNGYVDLGTGFALDTSSSTVCAWIKPTYPPSSYTTGIDFLSKKSGSSTGAFQFMINQPSAGGATFTVYGEYQSVGTKAGTQKYPANQWHMICYTYDRQFMRAFVDGVEDLTYRTAATAAVTDTTAVSAVIGRSMWTTYPSYFKGGIDELFVVNGRAMPGGELMRIYKLGYGVHMGRD